MTGGVTWEQLIWLSGIVVFIITTMTAIFVWIVKRQEEMHRQNLAAYKSGVEEQQRLRHDLRAAYDHKFSILDEKIGEERKRIDELEIFNAGLRMLLKTLDEFKANVREDFDKVRREQKEEGERIDEKLTEIIRDQARRRKAPE